MSKSSISDHSQRTHGFFGVALAALSSLAACGSVQTPAPTVAPETTPLATVAASARPAETVQPPPATAASAPDALCADGDEACERRALPLLTRVLPTVASAPHEAFEALSASNARSARVWAAYVAHHEGDDATASAMLDALEREGLASSITPDEVSAPGARALYLARELVEALSDSENDLIASLPCEVFAWDGEAARRAFGPVHGSTRDRLIAPFKERCAVEALRRALPPAAQRGVLAASDAMSRALFREFPRPDEGTMWTAVEIDAREALTESLLGFTSDPRERDAAMRDVVARLAAEDPRALPRVGNYRRSAEAHMTALANGICAVARSRGQAITGGQCQRQAYNAQLSAFTTWVGALHAR